MKESKSAAAMAWLKEKAGIGLKPKKKTGRKVETWESPIEDQELAGDTEGEPVMIELTPREKLDDEIGGLMSKLDSFHPDTADRGTDTAKEALYTTKLELAKKELERANLKEGQATTREEGELAVSEVQKWEQIVSRAEQELAVVQEENEAAQAELLEKAKEQAG